MNFRKTGQDSSALCERKDARNCDVEFAVSDLEGFLGYSTSYLQSEQLFYLSR